MEITLYVEDADLQEAMDGGGDVRISIRDECLNVVGSLVQRNGKIDCCHIVDRFARKAFAISEGSDAPISDGTDKTLLCLFCKEPLVRNEDKSDYYFVGSWDCKNPDCHVDYVIWDTPASVKGCKQLIEKLDALKEWNPNVRRESGYE